MHFELAMTLNQQGQHDEAVACYRQGAPAQARLRRGVQQPGRGLLMDQGDAGGAVAVLRQSLRRRPDFAESHYHLGLALPGRASPTRPWPACGSAPAQPEYAEFHNNLGIVLRTLGGWMRPWPATSRFSITPDHAEYHNNLGVALALMGKPEEAVTAFNGPSASSPATRAYSTRPGAERPAPAGRGDRRPAAGARVDPEFVDAHWDQAVVWLLGGNFEQGWPEYEWRWRSDTIGVPSASPCGMALPWPGEPSSCMPSKDSAIRSSSSATRRCSSGAAARWSSNAPSSWPGCSQVAGIDQLVPAGSPLRILTFTSRC